MTLHNKTNTIQARYIWHGSDLGPSSQASINLEIKLITLSILDDTGPTMTRLQTKMIKKDCKGPSQFTTGNQDQLKKSGFIIIFYSIYKSLALK